MAAHAFLVPRICDSPTHTTPERQGDALADQQPISHTHPLILIQSTRSFTHPSFSPSFSSPHLVGREERSGGVAGPAAEPRLHGRALLEVDLEVVAAARLAPEEVQGPQHEVALVGHERGEGGGKLVLRGLGAQPLLIGGVVRACCGLMDEVTGIQTGGPSCTTRRFQIHPINLRESSLALTSAPHSRVACACLP